MLTVSGGSGRAGANRTGRARNVLLGASSPQGAPAPLGTPLFTLGVFLFPRNVHSPHRTPTSQETPRSPGKPPPPREPSSPHTTEPSFSENAPLLPNPWSISSATPPSQNLHLLTDPSTSQGGGGGVSPTPLGNPHLLPGPHFPHGTRPIPHFPGSPFLSSRTSPGACGPGLTSRLLHGDSVQLAVALQRGDVRGTAELGRRRPTPRPAPRPSLLPAPAPAAAAAPLLRKPHSAQFRAR